MASCGCAALVGEYANQGYPLGLPAPLSMVPVERATLSELAP
ncbi:hypothetical protein PLANPX_0648 [Lacipirellula parvula]|uniref:Uncharacterized protein n=1 Tax=Lacipirellula parvula TaxID=2650471 RepID=A0A5K7X9N0_9BACT|nr:hypothetical protein PLANPX_0648 [Lacipirellula parvula]